ncbi:hypothetical protein [Actinoplanes sp. NPDC026619]|uniref:hypothetical protein n=1 Tax=Actinoplanes sp. NPDC026619 TaxID=3155798 RepID=UPI0033CBAE73
MRQRIAAAEVPKGAYPPKSLDYESITDGSNDVPAPGYRGKVLWVLRVAYLTGTPYRKLGRVVHGIR